MACANGHAEIVRLLLDCNCKYTVNPGDYNNLAIILATRDGYIDIVRILIDDIRVNPADCDNKAIKSIIYDVFDKINGPRRYDYLNIVKLLYNNIYVYYNLTQSEWRVCQELIALIPRYFE